MANRRISVPRFPALPTQPAVNINIIENGDGTVSLYVDDGVAQYSAPITASGQPVSIPVGSGISGSGTAGKLAKFTAGSVIGDGDPAAVVGTLGFTPEDVANKTTDGTLAANSDTLYPSEKAVKTYADTKQAALGFTPEDVANKAAADGYASLDSGGDVPLSQLGNAPSALAQIGARVNKSAVQAINDSITTVLTFDQEVDDGGFHDNVTNNNRLTIPAGKGGWYVVACSVCFTANAIGDRIVTIRNQAAARVASTLQALGSSAQETRMTCTAIVKLAAGDWVEVSVFQNSTVALNVTNTSDGTWFGIAPTAGL